LLAVKPEDWRTKTFGKVIREVRKSTGLTRKAVAEQLHRGDGRKVLPPFLNDWSSTAAFRRRNAVIEKLTKILTAAAGGGKKG
jgi:transcriptional regulator with XRE-family HTH domain